MVFAGVVFAGIECDFIGSTRIYDLVNVYITMGNHHAFHGKTDVISMAILNIYVGLPEGMYICIYKSVHKATNEHGMSKS